MSNPPRKAARGSRRSGSGGQQQRAGDNSIVISSTGDNSQHTTNIHPPEKSWWTRTAVVFGVLAATVTILGFFGIKKWAPWDGDPPPPVEPTTSAPPPVEPTGSPPPPPPPVPTMKARIVHTQDTSGVPVGVIWYSGPDSSAQSKEPRGSWKEGDTVIVVCQERHGRLIRDAPWPGRAPQTTVWNRLQWPVPMWIPDLYTDLPNKTGAKPPGNLKTCS